MIKKPLKNKGKSLKLTTLGFTLIELLAVIVILAIIALIATPIVINIIEESKKNSIMNSSNGIVSAAEYYYASQILNGNKLKEDKVFTFPNNIEGLEFNGEVPEEGALMVNTSGDIALGYVSQGYCITKNYDDDDIILTKDNGNCISDHNVVVDYSKPINIDVCSDITDEKTTCTIKMKSNEIYTDSGVITQESGKLIYTPTKIMDGMDTASVIIETKDEDGNIVSNSYKTINVIPAPIMYYETDFADGIFEFTSLNADDWTIVGSKQNEMQTAHQVGSDKPYGYDESYLDDTSYSSGSSWLADGQGFNNTQATFSFTGTGLDIISKTDWDQGTVRVWIYDQDGNEVKKVSVILKVDILTLYQPPIVSVNDLEYGTYKVVIGIMAGYTAPEGNAYADTLYRGSEFYFDAIRIHNTMGTVETKQNKLAFDIYKQDGEYSPQITNISRNLIAQATFNGLTDTETAGFACFENADDGTVSIIDCSKSNNEVYLNANQGVAFKIYKEANMSPASFDIGVKTTYFGSVSTLKAMVCTVSGTCTNAMSKEVSSLTDMYYDVMSGSDSAFWKLFATDANGKNYVYIIFQNTGENSLSLTNIKMAYDSDNVNSEMSFVVPSNITDIINSAIN